jgi:membrane associated rhomboid family serine protease
MATFWGGHIMGSRLALSMYFNNSTVYLSGFSAGLAALEGYNISYQRHGKEARRKIFYSLIRLTLNTLCFLVDQGGDEADMKFKNFAFMAQFGGLLFGLAYGELYGRSRVDDRNNN